MSRTRIVGGKITEIIGGDYKIYSKGPIEYISNDEIIITGKNGITYGEPESIKLEDAFIPIVELIESKYYNYIFEDIEGKVYELDFKLDRDKRKQGAKKLRFTTEDKHIYLTFKVSKGNKTSEDEDGTIRAKIHYKNGEMEEKEIDTAYGKTFDLYVEVDKLAYIQFFADDDFYFFNGNVSNVFCGQLVYDCQKPLRKEAVPSIAYLSKEQKAKFMAAVLVETGNGENELLDIAYIYLNLVNKYGFEDGMRKSSAYENSWVYDCHLRHLIVYHFEDKKYKAFNDWEKILYGITTLDDKVNEFKKQDTVKNFIKFCEEKIFIPSPISLYKDWEGQGNFEDMNLRMHNDKKYKREKWALASQYFHLQNQCKVKEKLVVELFVKPENLLAKAEIMKDKHDGTSYLFDEKKIENYFKKHPDKLPNYADGDEVFSDTGKIIKEKSPKNAIPPVYGFRRDE